MAAKENKMSYILIDTANMFFRARHVARGSVDMKIGLCYHIMFNSIKSKQSFGLKNIIAGIILGVPNYYSIIFLIKALQVDGFESSTLFTINNVGIVVCSTLLGLLIFKEKFSTKNKIGIFLALLGIILVSLT